MSFQVGERVRVIGNLPQKKSFVGQEGVVSGDEIRREHGATLVTLDGGTLPLLFWPSELARVEETPATAPEPAADDVGPTVIVLRSDPSYLIDLRQFGDGDHSQILLTQAETDRLIGALIEAVDG